MKRILVATALAVFGLVPAMGSACEYNDDSSASAAAPVQMGSAPPGAAQGAARPAPPQPAAQAAQPQADKAKPAATDRKLAAATSN